MDARAGLVVLEAPINSPRHPKNVLQNRTPGQRAEAKQEDARNLYYVAGTLHGRQPKQELVPRSSWIPGNHICWKTRTTNQTWAADMSPGIFSRLGAISILLPVLSLPPAPYETFPNHGIDSNIRFRLPWWVQLSAALLFCPARNCKKGLTFGRSSIVGGTVLQRYSSEWLSAFEWPNAS